MRRLLTMTLAVTLFGSWLIPNSADAGPLRRLFARLRGDGNNVVRTTPAESDSYRRYSYEPSTDRGTNVGRSRSAAKPNWWYPKTDPRRYGGGFE